MIDHLLLAANNAGYLAAMTRVFTVEVVELVQADVADIYAISRPVCVIEIAVCFNENVIIAMGLSIIHRCRRNNDGYTEGSVQGYDSKIIVHDGWIRDLK